MKKCSTRGTEEALVLERDWEPAWVFPVLGIGAIYEMAGASFLKSQHKDFRWRKNGFEDVDASANSIGWFVEQVLAGQVYFPLSLPASLRAVSLLVVGDVEAGQAV